jgi:hypothetical protein
MPKGINVLFLALLGLVSLLLFSCGSGDTVTVDPINPVETVSGSESPTAGGPGGGGGGNGSCLWSGFCVMGTGFDQSICTGGLGGTWYPNQTCTDLNYTFNCQSQNISGYQVTVCMQPIM